MNDHTPGPWKSSKSWHHDPSTTYCSYGSAVYTEDEIDYCDVQDEAITRTVASACGETAAEAVANARLMAAAPELLEACEAAFCRLKKLEKKNPSGSVAEPETMNTIIDAIAKAEGA